MPTFQWLQYAGSPIVSIQPHLPLMKISLAFPINLGVPYLQDQTIVYGLENLGPS